MKEILLATGNPGKAREIEEILTQDDQDGRSQVKWRLLSEFPGVPEPVEDGETFRANAEIKAHYYARQTGRWTIADDSGLQVDALEGAPGVYSSRFAGDEATDAQNNALLIQRLTGIPNAERTARFQCVVVLSDGENVLASASGTVEGRIVDSPRGENGFGYDPHFWIEEYGMTTAQMTPERKHAISHRGQALRRLREKFLALLDKEPPGQAS